MKEKKLKRFSGKEFRNSLKRVECIPALQEFLQIIKESDEDCVLDYLNNGGSCLELLQLLELSSVNIQHNLILECAYNVILKVSTEHIQYASQTQEACRYLLTNYVNLINKMLGLSSSGKERKVALKLLTAIVSFSPSLAKDILLNVKFYSDNLSVITSYSEDYDSVRNAFIYFLVSFLIEGFYPTISVFLEKKELLTSIINGMQFDRADLVCLILTSLKTNVLENPGISKTVKMKCFSTPVVKNIVNLYNWKGPKGYDLKKKEVRKFVEVDELEKCKVNETLHDFLLVLCTSHKYGVIFKDHTLGMSKEKQNNLMFTVLDSLERPWEHSYAGELVCKICAACPDLVRTTWSNLKPFLEPRSTKKWLNAIDFAKMLLKEISPSRVEFCAKEFNEFQVIQIIQSFIVPTSIIKIISNENYEFESPTVKHHVTVLLLHMLRRLDSYKVAAKNWLSQDQFRSLKNKISEHILRNFPTSKNLLRDWSKIEENLPEDFSPVTTLDRLNVIFELFEFYENICPQLIDGLSYTMNLIEFLNEVDNFGNEYLGDETVEEVDDENIENETMNVESETVNIEYDTMYVENQTKMGENKLSKLSLLKIRILMLFLRYDSSLFLPKSTAFDQIFMFLLKTYHKTRHEKPKEILQSIMKITQIFEGSENEINLWIDAIFNLKKLTKKMAYAIGGVIKLTYENTSEYLTDLAVFRKNSSEKEVDDVEEILQSLLEENYSSNVNKVNIKHSNLSPMILGALNYNLIHSFGKSEKYYLNFALINLFHMQTNISCILNILTDEKYPINLLQEGVLKYIKSWLEESPVPLEKTKGNIFVFSEFSRRFFEGDFESFLLENKNNLNTYEDLKLNLLQMVTFYVCNLTMLGKYENEQFKFSLAATKFLINLNGSNDCFKHVLSHPILLQLFNPLSVHKDNCKSRFTKFLVEFIKDLKEKVKGKLLILDSYRNKLLNSLQAFLSKRKINSKIEYITEIVTIFELNQEQSKEILNVMVNIQDEFLMSEQNVSFIYKILVYSLNRYLQEESSQALSNEIFNDLVRKLTFLNRNSIDCSTLAVSIENYLEKFSQDVFQNPKDLINAFENLFESILKSEFSKENSSLAVKLLQRCPKLINLITDNLQSLINKKGLILPLLDVISLQSHPEAPLQKIYVEFEPSILKALQKPQKAGQYFEKHIKGVCDLLEKFMTIEKCKSFAEKVQKYETTEVFHVAFLVVIYEKGLLRSETNEKSINNSILTLVHLCMSLLKKRTKEENDITKIETVVTIFNGFLRKIAAKGLSCNTFEQVRQNETFNLLCKFALKFGLSGSCALLKMLIAFVKMLNFSVDEAHLLMEMIVSHSEFIDVVLNEDKGCKGDLIELILILCQRWPSLMDRNHVPVFLAAYEASLRSCDRKLLEIFKLYESQPGQTGFYDFKPFLWSQSAASHYSVRADIQNSLWRQPKFGDVLDILKYDWILNTIKNYPLDLNFDDAEDSETQSFEADEIKRSADTSLKSIPKLLDKSSQKDKNIYDFRFLYPLFNLLLSHENQVQTYRFSRSGALSLTIAGLSSNKQNIRSAACSILSRFYCHLEARITGKDNVLWLRFLEAISSGLGLLQDTKLNNFVSIFFSRMALVLTQPTHVMYLPLSQYLVAKPVPDLTGIPELYTLVHSSEVNYKEHREFILQVLRDGMRTEKDVQIALHTMSFKIIMELFNSSVCDSETRTLILEILCNTCKIGLGAKVMCNTVGLLSFLYITVRNMKESDVALIVKIVEILFYLVRNLKGSSCDRSLFGYILELVETKHAKNFKVDETEMFREVVKLVEIEAENFGKMETEDLSEIGKEELKKIGTEELGRSKKEK